MRTPTLRRRLDAWRSGNSYVWNKVVVFVVLILAAEAQTDGLLVDHELDGLDPLDHLVTQLILDPKPERSAVDQGERLRIHLVC